MSSCPEALARAKMAEWAALDYVQRMIAATDRVEDEVLRTEMRADQVLMLHGQVRFSHGYALKIRACSIKPLLRVRELDVHELFLLENWSRKSCKHMSYAVSLPLASGLLVQRNRFKKILRVLFIVDELGDRWMWEHVSKVRACLNAIQALQKSKVKKMHELQLAQLVAGEKQSHTPYDLHLLQHRKNLNLHCHVIAAAKAIDDEKEACRKHGELFWQWMESVVNEALAVKAQSPSDQPPTIGVTEAEMGFHEGGKLGTEHWHTAAALKIRTLTRKLATVVPRVEDEATSSYRVNVPTDAKTEKAMLPECFKRSASIVDSCPCGDSWLFQHAKDIGKCLLRHPVYLYKPRKKPETRTIKGSLKKQDKGLQSASLRIQRLMHVDEIMKEILARTHVENHAVILETLNRIMENESFVVVDARA